MLEHCTSISCTPNHRNGHKIYYYLFCFFLLELIRLTVGEIWRVEANRLSVCELTCSLPGGWPISQVHEGSRMWLVSWAPSKWPHTCLGMLKSLTVLVWLVAQSDRQAICRHTSWHWVLEVDRVVSSNSDPSITLSFQAQNQSFMVPGHSEWTA